MPGGCEATAQKIAQPQTPPTEVLFEDAVLGPQVRDDLELAQSGRSGYRQFPIQDVFGKLGVLSSESCPRFVRSSQHMP
jgi:hypothetical protein